MTRRSGPLACLPAESQRRMLSREATGCDSQSGFDDDDRISRCDSNGVVKDDYV